MAGGTRAQAAGRSFRNTFRNQALKDRLDKIGSMLNAFKQKWNVVSQNPNAQINEKDYAVKEFEQGCRSFAFARVIRADCCRAALRRQGVPALAPSVAAIRSSRPRIVASATRRRYAGTRPQPRHRAA